MLNLYVILPTFQTRWKVDDFIKNSSSQPGINVADILATIVAKTNATVNEIKSLIKNL